MYTRRFMQVSHLTLLLLPYLGHAQTLVKPMSSRQGEPQCTVSAASNGEYNIGRLSGSLLKTNATTPLTSISKTWSISCDAEIYLTFNTIDNRADTISTPATGHYGLGRVNGTGKIGFYKIIMKNAAVDGIKTNVFSSNGTSFQAVATTALSTSNRINGWASAHNIQKSGLTFTTDLEVQPTLASITSMNGPITDNTEVDGSVGLHFSFGI